MGTLRVLPLFLAAVPLAFLGCTRESTPPKADVPVAKKDVAKKEPNNGTTKAADVNAPAVSKLLAKVANVSSSMNHYEKVLADPSGVHFLVYVASFPISRDDVQEVISQGLEKPAVSALIKLIQEKKSSTDKADRLVGSQAMIALSYFGPSAREATPLLEELQNHKDKAVGSTAKLALAEIGKTK